MGPNRIVKRSNLLNGVFRGVYELRRLVTGKPYIAEADVTVACNLSCRHCYHANRRLDHGVEEPPIETWERRFADLYRDGIRHMFLVGGEPALRPDVLGCADRTFPLVDVITNGTIRIAPEFRHRLFISIDGTQATNDELRGAGVFGRVLDNYRGDSRAVINMTLMERNYRELEDVVRIARDNGLWGVVCNIYTTVRARAASDPLVVSDATRRAMVNEMRRVKRLFPQRFMMTGPMLRWYETADHTGACYWRTHVRHFDAAWTARKCFGDADCSRCGCMAGTFGNHLGAVLHPIQMTRFFMH